MEKLSIVVEEYHQLSRNIFGICILNLVYTFFTYFDQVYSLKLHNFFVLIGSIFTGWSLIFFIVSLLANVNSTELSLMIECGIILFGIVYFINAICTGEIDTF